jgi:hypothetical protein
VPYRHTAATHLENPDHKFDSEFCTVFFAARGYAAFTGAGTQRCFEHTRSGGCQQVLVERAANAELPRAPVDGRRAQFAAVGCGVPRCSTLSQLEPASTTLDICGSRAAQGVLHGHMGVVASLQAETRRSTAVGRGP